MPPPSERKSLLVAEPPPSFAQATIECTREILSALAADLKVKLDSGDSADFLAQTALLSLQPTIIRNSQISAGTWVARQVLGLGEYNKIKTQEMTSDQIGYVPTRPAVTLSWLRRAEPEPGSVIFDVGAGDGMTAALIALARPDCKVVGVEVQRVLFRAAQEMAARNGIHNLEMRNDLAEKTDYSSGSVFYFFYPFLQPTFETVLQRIRDATNGRPITVTSLMNDLHVPQNQSAWLTLDQDAKAAAPHYDECAIYRSAQAKIV